MSTFITIEELANYIKGGLDSNASNDRQNITLVYAFNGTGKTRISESFHEYLEDEDGNDYIKTLSYNAFFEDIFRWDNEQKVLHCLDENQILKLIMEQGLENKITDNFQKLTKTKIFPVYNLSKGEITFSFSPGDDRQQENIKISRGEESLFVSSVFHTVLDEAISILNSKKENRETDIFNSLEYVIVDDPVSSIDDTKIITAAIELIRIITSGAGIHKLKFLITTHHALFFNVLYREFKDSKKFKLTPYLLSKNELRYSLEEQKESPFSYHLIILQEIKKALSENSLKKYHFNLLRGLLEKNAHFLGYKSWDECIQESEDKKEFIKWINTYSHSKLSDLESGILSESEKQMFEKFFNEFITKFNYRIQ